jgi:hypothetical protein
MSQIIFLFDKAKRFPQELITIIGGYLGAPDVKSIPDPFPQSFNSELVPLEGTKIMPLCAGAWSFIPGGFISRDRKAAGLLMSFKSWWSSCTCNGATMLWSTNRRNGMELWFIVCGCSARFVLTSGSHVVTSARGKSAGLGEISGAVWIDGKPVVRVIREKDRALFSETQIWVGNTYYLSDSFPDWWIANRAEPDVLATITDQPIEAAKQILEIVRSAKPALPGFPMYCPMGEWARAKSRDVLDRMLEFCLQAMWFLDAFDPDRVEGMYWWN